MENHQLNTSQKSNCSELETNLQEEIRTMGSPEKVIEPYLLPTRQTEMSRIPTETFRTAQEETDTENPPTQRIRIKKPHKRPL